MIEFLNQSPTSFHAADTIARLLRQEGWIGLPEHEKWFLEPGRGYYVERSGSGLIAFRVGSTRAEDEALRIALAHTDSPGLKLKPLSQSVGQGALRVGVEVYGSPIVTTWLDRELIPAGRVMVSAGGNIATKLFRFPEPMAIIPNLAIHFNRDINTKGAVYDPQTQLSAVFPLPKGANLRLEELVAQHLNLELSQIFDTELFLADACPASPINKESGFVASGRVDNLAGCHAVLTALTSPSQPKATIIGAFFAGEEVGSVHRAGAHSSFLGDVIERMLLVRGAKGESVFQVKSRSFMVSVDAAHGVHPNYADKHDPFYAPVLGSGPVLKTHASFKYASSAESSAEWERLCKLAGAATQKMITRSDLATGSTVGPVAAAQTGIDTVDVGIPIWAMHSIRETASLSDQEQLIQVLQAHFNP